MKPLFVIVTYICIFFGRLDDGLRTALLQSIDGFDQGAVLSLTEARGETPTCQVELLPVLRLCGRREAAHHKHDLT